MDRQFRKVAGLVDGELLETGVRTDGMSRLVFHALQSLIEEKNVQPALYFRSAAAGTSWSTNLAVRHGLVLRRAHDAVASSLTTSAILLVEECDVIVLIGVDMTYVPLVQYLQSRGVEVEIWAWHDPHTAILRKVADTFVALNAMLTDYSGHAVPTGPLGKYTGETDEKEGSNTRHYRNCMSIAY